MVDGKWQDNPKVVKSKFFLHFRKRFEKPSANRILIDMNFPKTISIDQQTELEGAVSKEEVKKAVWDCGSDKSPGSDGFSYKSGSINGPRVQAWTEIIDKSLFNGASFAESTDANFLMTWASKLTNLLGVNGTSVLAAKKKVALEIQAYALTKPY
ncbi:hypothetical protein Tco_0105839 [Tanacetum coccineum]